MLRKLVRTAPAALLVAGLVALPAAAGAGPEAAWPARLFDLLFAWFPDAPRTEIARSEGAAPPVDPRMADDVPEAGAPAPGGDPQFYGGESSEGEVAPSLDPNG